jgi:hypothetical protein
MREKAITMNMSMSLHVAHSHQQERLREAKLRCLIEVEETQKPVAQRQLFRFRLPLLFGEPAPILCAAVECKA